MPAEGWLPDRDSQIKFDLDKAKGKQPGKRDHQENGPGGRRWTERTSPLDFFSPFFLIQKRASDPLAQICVPRFDSQLVVYSLMPHNPP